MKNNRKNKGFTLIELILAMGIMVILMIALFKWEKTRSEIQKGENGGTQMLEIGKALSTYVATNQQYLIAGKVLSNGKSTTPMPDGCIATSVITGNFPASSSNATDLLAIYNEVDDNSKMIDFQGSGTCGGKITIPTTNILAAFGKAPVSGIKNTIGFDYTIQIINNQNKISALVVSAQGVTSPGNVSPTAITVDTNVNYQMISSAVRTMGGQGGFVPSKNTRDPNPTAVGTYVLQGLAGAWVLGSAASANPNIPYFPAINSYGLIGFRVSPVDTGTFDETYLRLDGTNYMTGNLNAGNWDIQNATNISYNGWMTGYGVLANTINSGQINNSGDITTSNVIATGKVRTTDVFLSNDANAVPPRESFRKGKLPATGLYLSEVIPKYVSMGVALTNSRVCGAGSYDAQGRCSLGSVTFQCPAGTNMKPRVVVSPFVSLTTTRVYGGMKTEPFCNQWGCQGKTFGITDMAGFGRTGFLAQNNSSGQNGNFEIFTSHDYDGSRGSTYRGPPPANIDVVGSFGLFEQAIVHMYCDIEEF